MFPESTPELTPDERREGDQAHHALVTCLDHLMYLFEHQAPFRFLYGIRYNRIVKKMWHDVARFNPYQRAHVLFLLNAMVQGDHECTEAERFAADHLLNRLCEGFEKTPAEIHQMYVELGLSDSIRVPK